MTAEHLVELPYPDDSASLFGRIAHLPWAVFLDSGRPQCTSGRYDIMAAAPAGNLLTRGQVTRLQDAAGVALSRDDPFDLIRRSLARRSPVPGLPAPFHGGAIGYFAYDLARRVEALPALAADDLRLPEMAIGLYDWALVVDHLARRAWLAGTVPDPVRRLLDGPARSGGAGFRVGGAMRVDMDRARYARAFERIKRYIRDGDCYQVNLARRFSVPVEGDPWALYRALRERNPAPFGAFLNGPFGSVLSVSPERFLEVRAGGVETCPIKGTRPRGLTPAEDAWLAQALRESIKDRAENLMIVDLLRNDLGRVCTPGTIQVPRLFGLATCPTVHHLYSTVTGRLRAGLHAADLLRACFPGGSITGAPKLRAMEIIEELEPHRRGVYCGAIGYLGDDGNMDTSIAIRTLVVRDGDAHFWAGGGIVADSQLDAEYQEILDKGRAVWSLLEASRVAHVGA